MQLSFAAGDLPYVEFAEKSVLGAIMVQGLEAMDACAHLRAEHFYLAIHRQIYQACVDILARQNVIGFDLVWSKLGKDADLAYIASLTEGIPREWSPAERVNQVVEAWKLRRTIQVCEGHLRRCVAQQPSSDTLASLQAEVFEVIQDSSEHDDPHVSAYADEIYDALVESSVCGTSEGFTYGDAFLDSWTGGMQPGQVTVVGARSGVGKSSLMKQATIPICRSGVGVVLFSLEMSRKQLFAGFYAILTGIDYRRITRPRVLTRDEVDKIRRATEEIKTWPLWIYDKADVTLDKILAFARMHLRRDKAKLIAVDYAQNVETDGKDERAKVAAVSRKLTKLVKDENAHLMLLSQLRKPDARNSNHPPNAADLRESGQLENDAHNILLLHRPWDEEMGTLAMSGLLIVPKARENQTGTITLAFNPQALTFTFSPRGQS